MGISGIAADYYQAGYVNRNQWRQINNIVWTGHPKHSIQ